MGVRDITWQIDCLNKTVEKWEGPPQKTKSRAVVKETKSAGTQTAAEEIIATKEARKNKLKEKCITF